MDTKAINEIVSIDKNKIDNFLTILSLNPLSVTVTTFLWTK